MWQTKYASAVPKNLGVGVNFRPCSDSQIYVHGCGIEKIFKGISDLKLVVIIARSCKKLNFCFPAIEPFY